MAFNDSFFDNKVPIVLGQGQTFLKVTSVEEKFNEKAFALTTVDASKYEVLQSTLMVVMKDGLLRRQLRVNYEVNVEEQEFQKHVNEDFFNGFMDLKNTLGADMEATAKNMQVEKILTETSPYNKNGEAIGGFLSLSSGAKPQKFNTKKPRIVQMQQDVADGAANISTGNAAAIKKIMGKFDLSNTSFLKQDFTMGAPGALLKTVQKRIPQLKERKALEVASKIKRTDTSLNEKTFKKLGDSLRKFNKGNTAAKQVSTQVKKTHKEQMSKFDNPANELNPLGAIGPTGRSGANLLANVLGKFKNVVKEGPTGNIFSKMGSLAKGIKLQPDQKAAKDIIEGIDADGNRSLRTNIFDNISVGKTISGTNKNPMANNSNNITANNNKFEGDTVGKDFEFKPVTSMSQIVKDFLDSPRGPTCEKADPNAILCLVVTTTGGLYGNANILNMSALNKLYTDEARRRIKNEVAQDITLSSVEQNAKVQEILAKEKKQLGIQAHYVILSNGLLMRGRPVDEIRSNRFAKFNKSGVEVLVVANPTNLPNRGQLDSLETVIEAFYTVFPGGRLFGEQQVSNTMQNDIISVSEYEEKFEKIRRKLPLNARECPTKIETVLEKPIVIAKAGKTKKSETITIDKIEKDFQRINELDGSVIEQEVDAAMNEMNGILNGIDGKVNDKLSASENAKFLKTGDKFRVGLEKDVTAANKFLDTQSGKFDSLLKNLNLDGQGASKLKGILNR